MPSKGAIITIAVQVFKAAERLRVAIAKKNIQLDSGLSLNVNASFGVISTNGKSTNIDKLLIQADAAMYQAKESGRNQVCSNMN